VTNRPEHFRNFEAQLAWLFYTQFPPLLKRAANYKNLATQNETTPHHPAQK
jgi:hypothetical protein